MKVQRRKPIMFRSICTCC